MSLSPSPLPSLIYHVFHHSSEKLTQDLSIRNLTFKRAQGTHSWEISREEHINYWLLRYIMFVWHLFSSCLLKKMFSRHQLITSYFNSLSLLTSNVNIWSQVGSGCIHRRKIPSLATFHERVLSILVIRLWYVWIHHLFCPNFKCLRNYFSWEGGRVVVLKRMGSE